ncbi:uncharacterized protein V3H82_014273 [Fundulus diaphanus]
MLAQCEDENLQLSLEITELQVELASAQRSSVKARSATEELEETRQTLKEVQETASHTQRRFSQLSAETERLRIHIRVLEDKNEKLTFERAYAEESVDELKRVNTKLRAQHEETLTLMMLKDKEITKKNILMDKMKNFHVENHKMMEGLQSELRRLQEHSHRQLLRFDRQRATPQSFHSVGPPNQHSLQTETQNLQPQLHRGRGDNSVPVVHSPGADILCILRRIKRDETSHHLYSECPQKERPFPLCQRQQAALRQELSKVQQEPVLHGTVWEEKREKDEKKERAREKEQKQSQAGSQHQLQEARKVVKVKVEEATTGRERAEVLQEQPETQIKLLQAEDAISDMKKQVCHLRASLKSGQDGAEQKHTGQVPHIHRGDDAERQEAGTAVDTVVREQGDAAVAVEPEKISTLEPKQTEPQAATGGLLVTLKRIEAMVSSALGMAEVVRQSERKVSQVREKMESITQKAEEEASARSADTSELLETKEECPAQVCDSEKFGDIVHHRSKVSYILTPPKSVHVIMEKCQQVIL